MVGVDSRKPVASSVDRGDRRATGGQLGMPAGRPQNHVLEAMISPYLPGSVRILGRLHASPMTRPGEVTAQCAYVASSAAGLSRFVVVGHDEVADIKSTPWHAIVSVDLAYLEEPGAPGILGADVGPDRLVTVALAAGEGFSLRGGLDCYLDLLEQMSHRTRTRNPPTA